MPGPSWVVPPMLGSQSVDTTIYVGDFADIGQSEEYHQHTGETETVSSVRRHAVAEEVQVESDGFQFETLVDGLLTQDIVTMFSLSPSGDFEPLPQKVEAVGQLGVVCRPHVVERSNFGGVVSYEHHLVSELFHDVGAELPFAFGVEVIFAFADMASLSDDVLSFDHRHSRERKLRNNHFNTEEFGDMFTKFVLDVGNDETEPLFLELHHFVMGFDPGELDVHAGKLRVMADSVGLVGSEHRTDLEDAFQTGGHGHLLEELRRLGQEGFAAEVGQTEQFTAGFAGAPHQFGRVHLDEAFLLPEQAHGMFGNSLDSHDELLFLLAKVEKAPVQSAIQG